jgi:hypothetical protein
MKNQGTRALLHGLVAVHTETMRRRRDIGRIGPRGIDHHAVPELAVARAGDFEGGHAFRKPMHPIAISRFRHAGPNLACASATVAKMASTTAVKVFIARSRNGADDVARSACAGRHDDARTARPTPGRAAMRRRRIGDVDVPHARVVDRIAALPALQVRVHAGWIPCHVDGLAEAWSEIRRVPAT